MKQAAATNILVTDGVTCDVHWTAMPPARVWLSMQSTLLNLLASAGGKVAVSAHTRETTALLLSAALAHLDQLASSAQRAKQAVSKPQHAQHDGAAATAGVKAEMANIVADSVRTFYEKELMMYLTARVKSPQGEAFYSLVIASYPQLHCFDCPVPNCDAEYVLCPELCAQLLARGSKTVNLPHLQIFACQTQAVECMSLVATMAQWHVS